MPSSSSSLDPAGPAGAGQRPLPAASLPTGVGIAFELAGEAGDAIPQLIVDGEPATSLSCVPAFALREAFPAEDAGTDGADQIGSAEFTRILRREATCLVRVTARAAEALERVRAVRHAGVPGITGAFERQNAAAANLVEAAARETGTVQVKWTANACQSRIAAASAADLIERTAAATDVLGEIAVQSLIAGFCLDPAVLSLCPANAAFKPAHTGSGKDAGLGRGTADSLAEGGWRALVARARVRRTVVGDAVAHLGRVARPGRSVALGALGLERIRGARLARPVACSGQVAETLSGSALEPGGLDEVRGTAERDAVAGLGQVASAVLHAANGAGWQRVEGATSRAADAVLLAGDGRGTGADGPAGAAVVGVGLEVDAPVAAERQSR